ncbi:LysE family translocator [Candidatus Thioglobus sp.]|jgi:threonine/homoserine/homoserine lactone efflux protein|nr:LysE family translocator [Candidatus Thioglobus sp.]MDB3971959.1 LysE family translocator [Candidatus Thioglobus sp.]MDC0390861.1 LysE family translocator [Candidatus Thioglobus sp.]MDC0407127.1 LysE family translocator [Candidatus Thioglobus sp.]
MTLLDFTSLFLIAFVFVITPGPGTLAVFAKSMSQGFMPAFYLSLGMVLGDLMYLSVVLFSLDLFAEVITPLMDYVRILGGLYLVYLGYGAWNAHKVKLSSKARHKSNAKEFLTGLLISLTNPKVMIFYIAILPAFIDLSQVSLLYALEILATVGLGLIAGISAINITVGKIKQIFAKPGMDARINKISGVIMMSVGVLLGLS